MVEGDAGDGREGERGDWGYGAKVGAGGMVWALLTRTLR